MVTSTFSDLKKVNHKPRYLAFSEVSLVGCSVPCCVRDYIYKKDNIFETKGNFWGVSNEVLSRIENASYLDNKEKHNTYLWFNPFVAKKRSININ